MFTNQNQSSGKFWISVFIVGVLVFLGQFAHSQHKVCVKRDSGGTCSQYRWDGSSGSSFANTASGDCILKGRSSGEVGCVSVRNNRCSWAIEFCTSPTLCKNNVGPNNWYDGKCNSGPKQEQSVAALQCPTGQREGVVGITGTEKKACVCEGTGKEPVDGECKSSESKSADDKTMCENNLASWVEGDIDGSGCYCEGQVVQPSVGCKKVAEKKCIGGEEVWTQGGAGAVRSCRCNDRLVQEVNNCSEIAASPAVENPSGDTDVKFANVLNKCGVDKMQARIDECNDETTKAVEDCDVKAISSDEKAAQFSSVLKLLGTVQQNKAVQSADPDACGKAAYIGSAATIAIDAFKTKCDAVVGLCKKACSPLKDKETFKQLSLDCEQMYNTDFLNAEERQKLNTNGRATLSGHLDQVRIKVNANKVNGPNQEINSHEEARAYIRSIVSDMEKKTKDNLVKCESDAVKGSDDIGKYLSEILTASMGAAQCKNQASNSAARCSALSTKLTPQYCSTQCGIEVCCAPYCDTIVDCNGKDYTSKQCVCARTPDAATCKNVTTSPAPPTLTNPGGVSNLADPGGIKSGNQYKSSGGIGGGGFEVGNDMDPSKTTPTGSTGGSTNPFGVASGGGGGGGGGVPNSPNDGSGAPAPGAEAPGTGLGGGAFNQLKTLADRIFGNGPGSTANGRNYGNGTGKDGKKNGNDNKIQPGLRGVAGGSNVFGPRNKDIWKIMNVQYGIQNHTFISNEK